MGSEGAPKLAEDFAVPYGCNLANPHRAPRVPHAARMPHRALHLFCYDIADPARLKAALDLSRRYATGGQKSVHECWLSEAELGELIHLVAHVINEREDRVLVVRLDPRRDVVPIGAARSPVDRALIIIGGPS